MAIAALIISILSLILCWIPFLGPILALVGIVLSIISLVKKLNFPCALIGLILAIIAIPITMVMTTGAIIASSAADLMNDGSYQINKLSEDLDEQIRKNK